MTLSKVIFSKKEARRFVLHSSGLGVKWPFGSGKSGAESAIDHLGYVQIDTISVIQRAHHHVLRSRVPDYNPVTLQSLIQKDKTVFEYWSHAAAFLPMKDFRYSYPLKQYFKDKKDGWPKSDPRLMESVYEVISKEGPKMARDFEDVRPEKGGWWNLKPAKWALDRLFLEGDLIVSGRRGFQKVYDLPERGIPQSIDLSRPTDAEFARYLIRRSLKAHGIARDGEISYLRRGRKQIVRKELAHLLEEGELVEVTIRGSEHKYFALRSVIESGKTRILKKFKILSPFDNAVIQRDRLKNIFDFEYLIECYVPKEKRRFGYFVCPLLFGDQFVGRVDAKADRKSGTLLIHSLYLESHIRHVQNDLEGLAQAIREFTVFNGCSDVQLNVVLPTHMKTILNEALK